MCEGTPVEEPPRARNLFVERPQLHLRGRMLAESFCGVERGSVEKLGSRFDNILDFSSCRLKSNGNIKQKVVV